MRFMVSQEMQFKGLIQAINNLGSATVTITSMTCNVIGNVTGATGAVFNLFAAAGQNVIMKLGDAAGVNKLSIVNSSSSEVAKVDSDGNATFTGNVTAAKFIGVGAYGSADLSGSAPSLAQLTSAFGTPAATGAGFKGLYEDTHSGAKKLYIVVPEPMQSIKKANLSDSKKTSKKSSEWLRKLEEQILP